MGGPERQMQHVNGHIPLHRRELAQVAEQVLQHGLLLLCAVGELIQPCVEHLFQTLDID